MILVVDGQRIYNYEYQEPPPIATNSLGFIDIEFRLSEEWDGHICTAQFVQHKESGPDFVASKVLYNNHVTFPDGIVPGVLEISLFGYKAGEAERGTTFPYLQPVYRSGFTSTEETPIPPTPDLYAQLLAQIQQKVRLERTEDGVKITLVNQDGEESQTVYDGKKGDKGDPGGTGGGCDCEAAADEEVLGALAENDLMIAVGSGDGGVLCDEDGNILEW